MSTANHASPLLRIEGVSSSRNALISSSVSSAGIAGSGGRETIDMAAMLRDVEARQSRTGLRNAVVVRRKDADADVRRGNGWCRSWRLVSEENDAPLSIAFALD